jgi:hypothetical protein
VAGSRRPAGGARGPAERAGLWSVGAETASVCLPEVLDSGEYLSLVAVVPAAVKIVDVLVDDVPGGCLVGAAPVSFAPGGPARAMTQVALHRAGATDPPVLAITPMRWLVEADR